ncbi:histidine phosphatase family protein [Rhodoferax sp. WC2427]|uniref:histidine phosphatase family protein n=1 Tax=Rhodoferax sp. WC2427 TaxID=3234144 RepID=UPI003467140A
MDATRIIAIRHGETAWNVDTRLQGQLDIPLNDTGRWQAHQLALALAGEPITAVYASDLWRAYETALSVAGAVDLNITTDEGLRERGFGSFQGRTFTEIEAELPEQALRWRKRDPTFAPEGGECLNDFRDRVLACVDTLAARHPGELITVVAHGGVMDVLYRAATGQGLQAPRTWDLGNAAINRLLWTPEGFTLVGWADTNHLEQQGALDENSA